RIVWLRNKRWQTDKSSVDGGVGCSIMAFDTEGKGERELVPEGELYNPLISPSGRHVIYTAKTDGKLRMHCVDWNGANSRVLGEGYALWAWREPATGSEWVYTSVDGGMGTFVDRFQFDKPEARERIYTGRLSNHFSLSADGTRAVSEFPHPATGMFYPRTGQLDRKDYRPGCNTYISPDNSYFVTIMAGSHDLVTLYKPDGSSRDVSLIPPGLKPVTDGSRGCMWNPKWASDARHMSVAGPFVNLGPNHADIWLGQFADDCSSIATWVQVTDNEFMDVLAYVWVDPGLGEYAGEAPYTLEVPAFVTGPGDWRWSYGDGTTGTTGKHTYGKAGTYALTSKQGDRTLEGTVRVAERAAPKLLNALALDDRRVLLTYSEPIQVTAAQVTLASGPTATKLSLDSEGSGIIAEFAAPLVAKETLTVKGVSDCAQVPNEMAAAQAQVVVPDWPSNRAGLTYLWQNARARNVIIGSSTNELDFRSPPRSPVPPIINCRCPHASIASEPRWPRAAGSTSARAPTTAFSKASIRRTSSVSRSWWRRPISRSPRARTTNPSPSLTGAMAGGTASSGSSRRKTNCWWGSPRRGATASRRYSRWPRCPTPSHTT
ncbi:MAG: hypothetical protein NTY17_00450, partial [Planctomycetia bacterium]|nr:hypothetical protein [Planctomycetia bacterium]